MTRAALAALLFAFGLAASADEPRPGATILLVAGAELMDPNFRQTVVLVTRPAGVVGPVGVILNRPSPVTLARVFPDVKPLAAIDDKVYFGGPVARQAIAFVHRAPSPPQDAIEVVGGVYLSWNGDLLRELLARDQPVEGLRVYAGHAAWAPGQLEAEVARGFWRSARAEERLIFESKPETLWPELTRRASMTTVRLDAAPAATRGETP